MGILCPPGPQARSAEKCSVSCRPVYQRWRFGCPGSDSQYAGRLGHCPGMLETGTVAYRSLRVELRREQKRELIDQLVEIIEDPHEEIPGMCFKDRMTILCRMRYFVVCPGSSYWYIA